uniref:Hydrolase family protein n=1 Tax=Cucumis sativus TaxID=3659 RepID=B3U2B6_CUCSA|nr:hydrolase family protein [Cucumis sativus]
MTGGGNRKVSAASVSGGAHTRMKSKQSNSLRLSLAPRIKLRDGRHLAYKEHGVPKDKAKYKIVSVHGFDSCRHDTAAARALSPEFFEGLGIYILSFDRPGYGESDPNPKRTVKSAAMDIEELADQLALGSKFYVIGGSMGGLIVWSCLKYIPNRLAGAVLIAPVINYWWSGLPENLSNEAFKWKPLQDQWALSVAHYTPWLTYWWNTRKWFPASSIIAHNPDVLSPADKNLIPKLSFRHEYAAQIRQQGEYESLHQDLNVGFSSWEFSPLDLKNPFPHNNGSIHIWQGDDDRVVSPKLQRYIAEKLPWIRYHEGPPITAPRIKLRDGRYLAYKEHGVPKDSAKYKIIYIHSFCSCRHNAIIANTISPDIIDNLGIYILSFDRSGYGESDPNPNRTPKTIAYDIEELADQLELGSKFYVVGFSMGGQAVWSCLNYIPNRLAGAALLAPVVNYWWPGLPANLTNEAFYQQFRQDQWTVRVAHYTPWLTYWWNTQRWFPSSSIIAGNPEVLSRQDKELLSKQVGREECELVFSQQGEYESIHKDTNVGFGSLLKFPTFHRSNKENSTLTWKPSIGLYTLSCVSQLHQILNPEIIRVRPLESRQDQKALNSATSHPRVAHCSR